MPNNSNKNQESKKSAQEADKSVDHTATLEVGEQQQGLDQATRASEAAYTLEPEKGLTPDPETVNDAEDADDYNIKQIDSSKDE